MRLTSRSKASGSTSIAPWIKRAALWISLEQTAGHRGRQAVLFPGDEATWRPKGDHLGRLRRLASSRRRIESRRHLIAPGTDPLLPVVEQRYRTRPSPDQTANPADARIQTIRDRGHDDPRHKVSRENQKTSVQS
jgi:hypothetical protein